MEAPSTTFNRFTLEQRELTDKHKNEVKIVSALNSDFIERVLPYPVCEVRQLSDLNQPMHLIVEPNAQKLILTFHRYGPFSQNETKKLCPFGSGQVHSKFISLIGKNNLLTTFEEKSQIQRKAVLTYFSRDKMENIRISCIDITKNWLDKRIGLNNVLLFDSCLNLVGECLIKGILGFKKCTEDDVRTNCDYWKVLLANKPSELQPANEFESEEKSFFSQFFADVGDKLTKLKTYIIDSSKIDNLCKIIYDETLFIRNSFANHLCKKEFSESEILENIKGVLLGGLETTGYLFGFLLYEYSRNLEMQKEHSGDKEKIKSAFLEALRLYSVGGALREADMDMALIYFENDLKKEHYIRQGDLINTLPWLAGHDSFKFENPEIFNPNRENLEDVKKIPHFGGGPHACIGKQVAEMEILTCISEILSRVIVKTDGELPQLAGNFTMRPIKDMHVQFFEKLT